jgi:hypothetical protein
MTASELAQGVQFTVDQDGRTTAVVLAPSVWQRIVDALEDAEDRELVRALQARLSQGPQGGAIRWQDVADEWQ